jgi:hypothetical protein
MDCLKQCDKFEVWMRTKRMKKGFTLPFNKCRCRYGWRKNHFVKNIEWKKSLAEISLKAFLRNCTQYNKRDAKQLLEKGKEKN